MQRALTSVVSGSQFVVPPYPAVALRLQRVLARDGYAIAEVADVVAGDPALATSVLAAANSALLGQAQPITSLSRAVNRLGARTVGAIAVASSVGTSMLSGGVLLEVRQRIWRRSMTCALVCQKLASSRGLPPEDAFLAGLLYGFGRSIAIASLEQLLKAQQPTRPFTVAEWLEIAEQQRAPLARALAGAWKLPEVIAQGMGQHARGVSALHDLVLHADQTAQLLDGGRSPEPQNPVELRLLEELIAGLPATLQAFAPPTPPPVPRAASASSPVAKPEQPLEGELRQKPALKVVDRRTKGAATLSRALMSPLGIEVESNLPFQEGAMVRLELGAADPLLNVWMTVQLCLPNGAKFRVTLLLFSPTRETREAWRGLYEAS